MIHIVGAGLAGCSLARLLAEAGEKVTLYEGTAHLGGLCREKTKGGIHYHAFGPHIFHTPHQERADFMRRFAYVSDYIHHCYTYVDGKYMPWPPNSKTIEALGPLGHKVWRELEARPDELNRDNFETCVIGLIGPTLYKLFVKGYTEKCWQQPATLLSADWAPKRIDVRKDDDGRLFKDQIQFIPCYNQFFERITEHSNITIVTERPVSPDKAYYLGGTVIWTGPLDRLHPSEHFQYNGPQFIHKLLEIDQYQPHAQVNFPEEEFKYFRITEAKHFTGQVHPHTVITVEYPGQSKMYPIITEQSKAQRQQVIDTLAREGKVIPFGRLGLFRYLDMHTIIGLAMYLAPHVATWSRKLPSERAKICAQLLDME